MKILKNGLVTKGLLLKSNWKLKMEKLYTLEDGKLWIGNLRLLPQYHVRKAFEFKNLIITFFVEKNGKTYPKVSNIVAFDRNGREQWRVGSLRRWHGNTQYYANVLVQKDKLIALPFIGGDHFIDETSGNLTPVFETVPREFQREDIDCSLEKGVLTISGREILPGCEVEIILEYLGKIIALYSYTRSDGKRDSSIKAFDPQGNELWQVHGHRPRTKEYPYDNFSSIWITEEGLLRVYTAHGIEYNLDSGTGKLEYFCFSK